MRCCARSVAREIGTRRAQLAMTRTVLDRAESFTGWPVGAMPASYGEEVASTPLSPEIVREGGKALEGAASCADRFGAQAAPGWCRVVLLPQQRQSCPQPANGSNHLHWFGIHFWTFSRTCRPTVSLNSWRLAEGMIHSGSICTQRVVPGTFGSTALYFSNA